MSDCAICFNNIKSPSCCVPCGHVYCTPCIERWTGGSHILSSSESGNCPQCRKRVKSIQIVRIDTEDNSEEVAKLQQELQKQTEEKNILRGELTIFTDRYNEIFEELQNALALQAQLYNKEKQQAEELNLAKDSFIKELHRLQQEIQCLNQKEAVLTKEKEKLNEEQAALNDKFKVKCQELRQMKRSFEEMEFQVALQTNIEDQLKGKLKKLNEEKEQNEIRWKHKEMQWERWKKKLQDDYHDKEEKLQKIAQSELLQKAFARNEKEKVQDISHEKCKIELKKLYSRVEYLEKEKLKLQKMKIKCETRTNVQTDKEKTFFNVLEVVHVIRFILALMFSVIGIIGFYIWR